MSDFLMFSKPYIECRDVDPLYDVLRAVCDLRGYGTKARIKYVLWYQMWYNLASAETAWTHGLNIETAKLPTGVERRGFRNGYNMLRHWDEVICKLLNSDQLYNVAGTGTWNDVGELLMTVWGNGRWAAYKGCELLQKVCGLPIKPTDMGHAHSSGPRKGLALLFEGAPDHDRQDAEAIAWLDEASNDLLALMLSYGIKCDMGEAETACCDFHTLHDGRYYVGHDIDHLQEAINKSDCPTKTQLMYARKISLPNHYLGELNGWSGVDKPRCKLYRDESIIAVRTQL